MKHDSRHALRDLVGHAISVMLVGGILFISSIAVMGVVDLKDPIVAGLVVQVINTLKDLFKAPSYALYGAIRDPEVKGEGMGEGDRRKGDGPSGPD